MLALSVGICAVLVFQALFCRFARFAKFCAYTEIDCRFAARREVGLLGIDVFSLVIKKTASRKTIMVGKWKTASQKSVKWWAETKITSQKSIRITTTFDAEVNKV